MNKYIIIPDCTDYNRGDQALIWETVRIAKEAGFQGEYYMQKTDGDCSQSLSEGIKLFNPILPHPSRGRGENNVNYNAVLVKWGVRAVLDLVYGLWVLCICNSRLLCRLFLGHNKKDTLSIFRESSAVFVKGGGFIHSFGGPTAFYFIFYHLYTINLALSLGLPVFVMPNSFGPIDGFLCKWQVRHSLRKCKLVYCRENISFDYMSQTFPKIKFLKSFDLGFYLHPDDNGVTYRMPEDMLKVAITVRPYRFPEHSSGDILYHKYIVGMRGLILWLIKQNYYPVLIQHTLANNAHEDDMLAIKEISSGLPEGKYGLFFDSSFNCRHMKSLYSRFDYIIGTRFHSVVFAMMEGVPAIAIAYGGNKTRGIMQDIGLGEYVIGIDEVEEGSMISLFSSLVVNRESIRAKLNVIKEKVEDERARVVNALTRFA